MKFEIENGEVRLYDFSDIQFCKIAKKIEKEGLHFYEEFLDILGRTSSAIKEKIENSNFFEKEKGQLQEQQEIIDTLNEIIKEEDYHYREFDNLLQALIEKEEDTFEDDDIVEYINSGIFFDLAKADSIDRIHWDKRKIIQFAKTMETRSIDFYKASLGLVSDDKAREVINVLIKSEQKHLQRLGKI